MKATAWHSNDQWLSLPKIEVGDNVELRFGDTFDYSLRAVVLKTGAKIEARVEAIFAPGVGQVLQSDANDLVGRVVEFKTEFVHRVKKERPE